MNGDSFARITVPPFLFISNFGLKQLVHDPKLHCNRAFFTDTVTSPYSLRNICIHLFIFNLCMFSYFANLNIFRLLCVFSQDKPLKNEAFVIFRQCSVLKVKSCIPFRQTVLVSLISSLVWNEFYPQRRIQCLCDAIQQGYVVSLNRCADIKICHLKY